MTNDSIDNLRLDISQSGVNAKICTRKNDTRTRTIHFSLVNKGQIVSMEDAIFAQILIKKPNQDENDQAMVIDGNELQYSLRTQDVNIAGECECQIVVTYEDGAIITSPPFYMEVSEQVIDQSNELSQNEYTALSEMVVEANKSANNAEASARKALASEQAAGAIESNVSSMQEDIILREENILEVQTDVLEREENIIGIQTDIQERQEDVSDMQSNVAEMKSLVEVAEANAFESEENAKTYEINSKASETKAKISEDNAKKSETNARTSELNAKESETKAKDSETNALKYKSESAESASNALGSEDRAKTSETNAKASEEVVVEKAEEITSAEYHAGEYASQASESAINAGTSADKAKISEDNAYTSESNALISEANAQGYMKDAKEYAEQAKRISESFAGAIRPCGTILFEVLPDNAAVGDMYNISNEFVTTDKFEEGAGHTIAAGANVYLTVNRKWDVLAGNPVVGVKGSEESVYRTGNVEITKENVGLGNVPNVSTNNQTPTFSAASTRANITSGEKLSTLLGKIAKWFSDLKTVAFTGAYSDLSGKPSIPAKVSDLSNDSGFTKVEMSRSLTSGTKIGTLTINGTTFDLYAPSGYTLPKASASALGGIKVGTNLSIDANGILSANDTTYGLATTSKAGLLSAADKAKIDSIGYPLPEGSE